MSSAKAALESDTRTLAFEAGRKFGVRVNTISAGPLASRAATAIGFIDDMIDYCSGQLAAPRRAHRARRSAPPRRSFWSARSRAASRDTTLYVDKGYHAMGVAVDRTLTP